MAGMYKGNVSVYSNQKGELTVRPDPSGRFSHTNTDELYTVMQRLSAEHNMPIRAFKPDVNGTTPVLLADRYGKPYLALLAPSKAPGKVTITKLA